MDLKPQTDLIQSWLENRASQLDLPPFSLAITHAGQHYSDTFHGSSYDITKQSAFYCIGSVSKTLTAACVLKLCDSGSLNLEDKVTKHLPWLTDHNDPRIHNITIEHLLSHTSGLSRDGRDSMFIVNNTAFPSGHVFEQYVNASAVVADVGNGLKYSNLGYCLLGRVIESVTQTTYQAAVDLQLLQPLGLSKGFNCSAVKPGSLVQTCYQMKHGSQTECQIPDSLGAYDAALGWYARPEDLCRLIQALYSGKADGRIKISEVMPKGLRNHFQPGQQLQYGLGSIKMGSSSRPVYGHTGAFKGYQSFAGYEPTTVACVTVLSSSNSVDVASIGLAIFEILQLLSGTRTEDNEGLRRFTGSFSNDMRTIYFTQRQSGLVALPLNTWNPLVIKETLTHDHDNQFTIGHDHPLLSAGEKVTFTNDPGQNIANGVNYAGANLIRSD